LSTVLPFEPRMMTRRPAVAAGSNGSDACQDLRANICFELCPFRGFRPLRPAGLSPVTFAGTMSRQQAGHADVLVEIGPMDPLTPADQSPVGALGRCPMGQARIPRQRHRHGTAVRKVDHECVLGDLRALRKGDAGLSRRSSHPNNRTGPSQNFARFASLFYVHVRRLTSDLPNRRRTGRARFGGPSASDRLYGAWGLGQSVADVWPFASSGDRSGRRPLTPSEASGRRAAPRPRPPGARRRPAPRRECRAPSAPAAGTRGPAPPRGPARGRRS